MVQIRALRRATLNIVWLMLVFIMPIDSALGNETITWGMLNIPPLWIRDGKDKGQGLQDQFTYFLESHLTGYEHHEVAAPIARVSAMIQIGDHWCTQLIRKPEREEWAYFSMPMLIVLPNEIVIRKDQRVQFERFGNPIVLESLLADRSLHLSTELRRSYGTEIDGLLKNRSLVPSHSNTRQAMAMLLANRFDYMIESPIVASYTAKQLEGQEKVIMLPIRESGRPYLISVACPKNDWGKRVIENVNAILLAERMKPEYREMMEKWYDEDGVREIRRRYDILLTNAN